MRISHINQYLGATPPNYKGGYVTADNSPAGNMGTRLMMVSTSLPISGIFYYSFYTRPGGSGYALLSQSTPTDAGSIANDVTFLTRSVKMQSITLASGQIIQGVDPIDFLGSWIHGRLVQTSAGTSFWHGVLTLNIGQVAYGVFRDPLTGQSFTIYSTEEITVYDLKGWSYKLQYVPSVAGAPWQVVPGSVRDNHGNKVNMVNNVPTTPIPTPTFAQLVSLIPVLSGPSWNAITITPFQDNLPKGSAIVCPSGCDFLGDAGGGFFVEP